jgi:DoxX-like family
VLLAIVFALTALPKMMGNPIAAPPFDLIGLGTPGMVVVGWLELAGAIALLVPRLCGLAAICQIFLMVGATVLTAIQTPELVAIPAATLVGVCRRLVPPARHWCGCCDPALRRPRFPAAAGRRDHRHRRTPHPTDRGLDERLAQTIERLAQVRRELALLLHETRHAPDLPGELMAVSSDGLTATRHCAT